MQTAIFFYFFINKFFAKTLDKVKNINIMYKTANIKRWLLCNYR